MRGDSATISKHERPARPYFGARIRPFVLDIGAWKSIEVVITALTRNAIPGAQKLNKYTWRVVRVVEGVALEML